ncbi:MAG TPA: hypothetical protein DDW30_09480 [Clostridiales bacterium]|nr:hypothetical protein [Clostridiales bacterium]
MVSHILRYNFAPFIRFEIIKKKEHRFEKIFSPKRCSFVLYFWMLQKRLHQYIEPPVYTLDMRRTVKQGILFWWHRIFMYLSAL